MDLIWYFFSSDPQDSVGRPKKTFRSEGRENALKLCGWGVPDVEPGQISPIIVIFTFFNYPPPSGIMLSCIIG